MAGSSGERIVVLIDMDCFFCQVETKLQPEFAGKPLAVVQYNQWQLGGIIAVNYEAREYGVTRHMRGEEAKEKCPDLVLASVPCLRGKSDTSRYRAAGREVINAIRKHCDVVERASVDEAYLDITDIVDKRMSMNSISPKQLTAQLSNTFVVGYSEIGKNDEVERSKGMETWISNIFEELEDLQAQKLAVAGVIVEELRADIFEKTGYRCSAGIAQNKILAKLACGLHKPNQQTILPAAAVPALYSKLPVKKVRNLGGKFGDVVVESLNCNVMGDLLQYSLQYLQKRFDDKTGLWLYNIARGVDNEPVTCRLVSKSIGACKKFPGKQAIVSLDVLKHWAGELSAEVCERLEQDLEENERRATLLTICYHYYQNRATVSQSRSCALTSYKPEKMASRCVDIITKSTQCPVAYLGISAGKFVQVKGSENFMNFFKPNKLKDNQQTSVESEDGKTGDTHSLIYSIETITSGLKTNKTTYENCDLKNVDGVSETGKKDIIRNSRTLVQLNEQHSDVNTDASPTSRKVNNLIESLNKRNKAKTLYKDEINNCKINESLDQDKFKGSFFMNIFNKDNKSEHDAGTHGSEVEESNDNEDAEMKCKKFDEDTIEGNIDNVHTKARQASGVQKCDVITFREKSDSDDKLDLNIERHSYIRPSTSYEIVEEENSSNVKTNENTKALAIQTSSVQLQEIFPDLNNIDPNIVLLLPLDLQKEAKLYMKAQSKNNVKATENVIKGSKAKNNKSKTNVSKGKKGNNIYTFLIKGVSCNSTDVPLKHCMQCNQKVLITKYDEHSDFHMAENLQRELNNPLLNNASIKRKDSPSDIDVTSIKRRPNADTLEPDKNCKTITPFLS